LLLGVEKMGCAQIDNSVLPAGMSWESTLVYYRLINEEVRQRLGGLHSADCLIRSLDFAEVEQLEREDRWPELAEHLAVEARALEASGAELLVVCANTVHRVAEKIANAITIPFLHIADAAGDGLRGDGRQTVGLLGTSYTMDHDFYAGRLRDRYALRVLLPGPVDRATVDRVIFEELVKGVVDDGSRAEYSRIISDLAADGADAILLACTEIGLLVGSGDWPVPVYDTAELHARAAVELALG
jgi:aspartate racemase